MKQISTLFLKGAIIFIGLAVLALYAFLSFMIVKEMFDVMPIQYSLLPIALSILISIFPFYIALINALKILNLIDRNTAFSELSIQALKKIKHCGSAFGILYVLSIPSLYMMAEYEDAPGVLAIGLIIIFAAFVVAVFAAVLEKLLQNALEIKTENDLTV